MSNTDTAVVSAKKQKTMMGIAVTNKSSSASAMRYMINNSLPNPDPVLKKIGKDIDEYDRIRTDPHVASCIQSRKSGTLAHKWELQSNNCPAYIYSFVKDVFAGFDIARIMNEMLEAPLYGYVVMELYWIRKHSNLGEPQVVINDIVAKPQTKFIFDNDGRLHIKNARGQAGDLCKNNKFLLLRTGQNFFQNPYGDPVLSKCYWEVHWKRNVLDMKFNYLDRFGIPSYAIKKDPSAMSSQTDPTTLQDALDNLVQGGSIVLPDGFLVDKLEGSSTMSVDLFNNMITMCNAEISKGILSQTLTTEQGDTGSYAMSQTHLQVRKDVIDSDKLIVEQAFNRVIDLLVEYNFGSEYPKPKFILYSEQDVDAGLATVVQGFLNTGKVKYEKEFYIKNFGWEESDFELVDSAPAFADNQGTQDVVKPNPKKKTVDNKTIQQMLDDAIANQLQKKAKNFNSAVTPIKNFLENKGSFEDAISSIMDLSDSIDYSEAEKDLTQILFVSDVIGRLSINQHLE